MFIHIITAKLNQKGINLSGKTKYPFIFATKTETLEFNEIVERIDNEISFETVETFYPVATIETEWNKDRELHCEDFLFITYTTDNISRKLLWVDKITDDGRFCLDLLSDYWFDKNTGTAIKWYGEYYDIIILDYPKPEHQQYIDRKKMEIKRYKTLDKIKERVNEFSILDYKTLEELEEILKLLNSNN
jgi:hypothetical protein